MPRIASPRTRVAAGVVAWLVVLVAATLIGITAVGAIGSEIVGAGEEPLSPSEVDARLSASPSVPPPATTPGSTATATPPATPTPSTTLSVAEAQAFPSRGGTVIARCAPGGVEVLSATPAQGYQVSSASREIDDHPSVKFTSGRAEVEVRLRCVGGRPQPEIRNKS